MVVAVAEQQRERVGAFTRMAQRVQSIGDDFGRLWLTIIGGLVVMAIAGGFAFAWSSNTQITTLTANSVSTQNDVRDIKADLRDLRNQLGIKPVQQPTSPP